MGLSLERKKLMMNIRKKLMIHNKVRNNKKNSLFQSYNGNFDTCICVAINVKVNAQKLWIVLLDLHV